MAPLSSRLADLARTGARKSAYTNLGSVRAFSVLSSSPKPHGNQSELGSLLWGGSPVDAKENFGVTGMGFDVMNSGSDECNHEFNGFMKGAPYEQNGSVLVPSTCGCLSHNCHIHQSGLGRRLSLTPVQIPKPGPSGSMILSNSYASSSRFEDKAKIRQLMESRGLKKEPGWSRIEIQGQLNTFLVDDKSHPRNQEIRVELQRILGLMRQEGYVADIRCVLRDIPDSQKEHALQHHSERLAMALGHISLPPRAPLRVIKNLRVCNDCHVATKYFAYIYKREIIVRDATRFHHFKDGYCSCGDYW